MESLKKVVAGSLLLMSFNIFAATNNAPNTETLRYYEDIVHSLPELEPVTWTAAAEKYKLLVFIDNQCIYCTQVVKNVKKYNDAGLTMSFITVAPSSIRDSVIEDMGRVWCSADRKKSLQNAMAGFLPDNDASEACTNKIVKQSALADRLGVTATPVMVVIDKSVHPFIGSVPPAQILSELQ